MRLPKIRALKVSWILFFLTVNSTGAADPMADLASTTDGLPSLISPDALNKAEITEMDGIAPRFEWDPHFDIASYKIGPNDIFNVHLFGGKNLSSKTYVSSEYELFIPSVGALNVRGLNVGKLRTKVEHLVHSRHRNTRVAISLFQPRNFVVQVSGAVGSPGLLSATQMTRLQDLLNRAGGISGNGTKLKIEIRNPKSDQPRIVNLQDFLLLGDLEGNPFLNEGDSVHVNFQKNRAVIKGNVRRPGTFEFEGEQKLSKVVDKYFGGMDGASPVAGNVVITRIGPKGPRTESVPAEVFFRTDSTRMSYDNFVLANGDQIYFPTSNVENPSLGNFVFVTGEVRVPGPQPFKAGAPFTAYLSAGGGIASRANYDQIVIYKASGEKISAGKHPTIEPGDTIHVPEKTFKFWSDHLAILTTLLTVLTTTIAISR